MVGGLLGEARRVVERQVAVDLVGRDLMEADVSEFAAGVHEHGRADDVRLQKQRRVGDRAVHVAFGREVDYALDVVLGKEGFYEGFVTDVAFDEGVVGECFGFFEVVKVARIGEFVQADLCGQPGQPG